MKHVFFLIVLFVFSIVATAQVEDEYAIADQYIVQLNGNIDGAKFFATYPGMAVMQCLSKHMNIWLIRSESKNLLSMLKALPAVRAAQHNHSGIKHRALVPNDSLFNLQWNMLNTAYHGADISATQAWQLNHSNLTRGGDTIVIAVVDGGEGYGFDIYHPDINFFVNHHEIPNNGIDDDGNGFIDDYHGWNVFGGGNDSVYDTGDPHATHVSGIAGAKGDNGIGVAGVCWGAKILAVNGAANDEAHVVMAYDYVLNMRQLYDQTAGAKGAFIVATNSSFGVGEYGANPALFPIWCAMYDSLGAYGILSSVAVPDYAVNVDQVNDVPTGCASRWMIAVTNTTKTDRLDSQAGYGPGTVDIGAPGGGQSGGVMSCYPDSAYGYDAGTSMSSPHLAGAVAALFANACPALLQAYFAAPDSVALLMKNYIFSSVDLLSSLENITATGGRLNLYHAFLAEDGYNCNNCHYAASLGQTKLGCNGDSTASITVNVGSNSANYSYLWSGGEQTNSLSQLGAGFYQVTVTDSTGCQRQLIATVAQPQPIVISSVTIIPISAGSTGNIIVSAAAGNDTLTYAIDDSAYQSGAIFVISVAGAHTIHIKNQSGCVLDTAVAIYPSGLAAVNGIAGMIKVYPNPSAGTFYFSGLKEESIITIYDMLGRNVYTKAADKNNYTITLPAKGIYTYRVSDHEATMQQGKIVAE